MKLIKQSNNLKEFLEKSESLQDSVNDEIIEMIEEENNLVSEKVSQSKFAYLVIKHRYYDKLNAEFEALNRETMAEI